MNKRAHNKSKLKANPTKDCHEKIFDSSVSIFSETNLPVESARVSLANFPIKNAGIIYSGPNLDMPAATNKGVVGKGNNE